MAILDNDLQTSSSQAITADAGSTTPIDLGGSADIGAGEPVKVLARVTEAFNNLTSLDVKIQTDDDAAFGTPDTIMTKNFLLAELTVDTLLVIGSIPPGKRGRYVRAYYDVNGTPPSTGKVTLALSPGNDSLPANDGAVA